MSIPAIPAIGAAGFTPMTPTTLPSSTGVGGLAAPHGPNIVDPAATSGAAGTDFGQILSQGIENLQGLHDKTDQLAVQAATGDLNAIHDYTITATEATVATQLTTAVRNKALEAFQEIMRMSI
ncbi:MAG: flagellar hook-basal body complex protein FliE [Nocardioidaceae bacterium]